MTTDHASFTRFSEREKQISDLNNENSTLCQKMHFLLEEMQDKDDDLNNLKKNVADAVSYLLSLG